MLTGALALIVALAVGGCGGGGEGRSAASTATQGPGTSIPTTGTQPFRTGTVDVEGHKVAFSCKGSGPKTVILLGDIGQDADQAWGKSKVPDGIADEAEVCTYDRPGLGSSEEAGTPRSVANHAKELGGLVSAGGMKGPIVLVGQGFGTLIARQYAKDNEVAGMVLLDPPLWGLDNKTPDDAAPGVKAEYDALADTNRELYLYGAGALPPGPIPLVVLGVDGTKPPLPEDLVGPEAPFSPTTTVFPQPEAETRIREQRTLGQKSPFGSYEEVAGAGSYLQYWNPEAVLAAIGKVLAQ